MLITSPCGTRERQSRSQAHLSTPSPSGQVLCTDAVITEVTVGSKKSQLSALRVPGKLHLI